MMPRKGVVAVLDGAAADRDGERRRVAFEPLLDILDGVGEVGADDVHLVDEDQARHLVLVGLPPDGFGLGLDAFLGVEDDDGAVEHAQAALDLGGEIDVAGRVDQVDRAVAPLEGNAGAVDGDAAFLLFLVVVGVGGALIDAAELVLGAGVKEDVLGGRRLAGIDVGNDADVADLGRSRWP